MQDSADKLTDANLQVVGISYDSVDTLKEFADAKGIDFPLLSDAGSKTINAYDLHNEKGLPHPATLVIDQQGKVRAKLSREGYRARHSVDELLAAAKKISEVE